MRIHADRDVCIGAGNCVMTADDLFDQDDDATVVVLADPVPEGREDAARAAVSGCPSGALRVEE